MACLVLLLVSFVGLTSACIPMHTDDFETTTPAITTTAATTTTATDPCAECTLPPVISSGFPAECTTTVTATVTLTKQVQGDTCTFTVSGCTADEYRYLADNTCGYLPPTATAPPETICMNGKFYSTQSGTMREINSFVNGCAPGLGKK